MICSKRWEITDEITTKFVDCVIIQRNRKIEMEYFLDNYPIFASKTKVTIHSFIHFEYNV